MTIKHYVITLAAVAAAVSTVAASTILGPGTYSAPLSPTVSDQKAGQIQSQVSQIDGLTSVQVNPSDSMVHFKVKDNAQVDNDKIAMAVKNADAGTSLGTPVQTNNTSGATGTIQSSPNDSMRAPGNGKY